MPMEFQWLCIKFFNSLAMSFEMAWSLIQYIAIRKTFFFALQPWSLNRRTMVVKSTNRQWALRLLRAKEALWWCEQSLSSGHFSQNTVSASLLLLHVASCGGGWVGGWAVLLLTCACEYSSNLLIICEQERCPKSLLLSKQVAWLHESWRAASSRIMHIISLMIWRSHSWWRQQ